MPRKKMVAVSGNQNVSLPHGVTKTICPNRESIVEAKISFDVNVPGDVSYIHWYK